MGKVITFPPAAADGRTPIAATTSVFVGRERELEGLRSGLEEACAGRGRLFLLAGEAGIGKTRIAQEFTLQAQQRNLQVFPGRCYEGDGAPPFWPWVQIVRAYLASQPVDTLRAELGAGATDIAHVMPEVRASLPDLPVLLTPESPESRFRFFDSFTTFVKNAARRQPVMLLLDDLHWADTPSLLLLQFLARELSDARLLIVGAYRDNELGQQHPLVQTLGELGRAAGSQSLSLQGLSESEVARFIELNSAHTLSPSLVNVVYQQTEGNPFFVTEVVRLLGTEEDQATNRQPQVASTLPPRVREVIGRRLRLLSAECFHALTLAAGVGREFRVRVLEAALPSPFQHTLLAVLDEAVAARLIAPVSQQVGSYSFSHALVRETLYESLGIAERVRLHRAIGEALETLYATALALPEQPAVGSSGQRAVGTSGSVLAELAAHFFLAAPGGDVDKAISYARRAGERALALLAYEEAVSHYQRALQALALKAPDEPLRCELLLGLGKALWHAGENTQARDMFEQAARLAQVLGAAELLAQVALGFGHVRAETGVVDEALIELLEAAQRALGERSSALRARVLARLAMALYFTRAEEQRHTLSLQAVAIARQAGDPGALAIALVARHFVVWGPGNIEERLALATEAMRLAEEAGDRDTMHEGQAWRILALLELGEIDEADREIESYIRQSVQLRVPRHKWYTFLVQANRAMFAGRFDECERLAMEAVSVRGEGGEITNAVTFFGAQMFALRWQQGRLAELEPAMTGFAAQFTKLYIWRCGLAVLYSEAGNAEAARREFGHLVARDFAELSRDANWLPSLALLAEVCRFLGDTRTAEALYARMLPYAGQNIVVATSVSCYGAAARYLGLLATLLERWDEAEQHLTAALAFNAKMGARPWVAYTEYDYALMLITRNRSSDHEKARELLDLTLATAQELGMANLQSKVQSLKSKVQSLKSKVQEEKKVERENSEPSEARPWTLDARLDSPNPEPRTLQPLAPSPQPLTPSAAKVITGLWSIKPSRFASKTGKACAISAICCTTLTPSFMSLRWLRSGQNHEKEELPVLLPRQLWQFLLRMVCG